MDDKELLALYREKGKEHYAFNLIVKAYSERLYWHIRKLVESHDDANDLLQNTFIKAWAALPEFREESRLFTWLYRIATNETLTFLKRKKIRSFLSLTDYSKQLKTKLNPMSTSTGMQHKKRFTKPYSSFLINKG